jgi:hypothetical protein
MTYTKPEINLLGDATRVIQALGKGVPGMLEFATPDWTFDPAYDLDE